MKYEYFDHTADAKFRAYGKTLEEAFENAALAFTNIMTDVNKVKPIVKREIKIEEKKQQALLFDFLEELVYLLDTEGFILSKIENLKIKDNILTATFLGDNGDNYDIHTAIKAMTYNDMFIKEENNKFIIQGVPDL